MSITSTDINEQGFEHSLRGYDIRQVDDFLEHVAAEIDVLNASNEELSAKNEILLAEIEHLAEGSGITAEQIEGFLSANSHELEEKLVNTEKNLNEAESLISDYKRKISDLESKLSDKENEKTKSSLFKSSRDDDLTVNSLRKDIEKRDEIISELELRCDKLKAEVNKVSNSATPILLDEARNKIKALEAQLEAHEENDAIISRAFIAAQRSADSIKEEARSEGERIYRESEAKAREFLKEALAEKQRVLNEIDGLKKSCSEFRAQYRELLSHFSKEADGTFTSIDSSSDEDNNYISSLVNNNQDDAGLEQEEVYKSPFVESVGNNLQYSSYIDKKDSDESSPIFSSAIDEDLTSNIEEIE